MLREERYPKEPPALPQYDISPELKKLVLMFMGAALINFLIAGGLAMGMRIMQEDVPVLGVNTTEQNVLWYAFLTAHGQTMMFGVLSMNTMWFSYYATSKWGRKPLSGITVAKASFWIMEAAIILILLSTLFGFGAGWYNLMPLTFLPGQPDVTWGTGAAATFLTADVLVGVSLTLFCIVIITTVLRGKIAVGTQRRQNADADEVHEHVIHLENLPASVRWASLLGITGWFPRKWRLATPHVSILVVAAFVTAMVQIVGNPGLFVQLAHGFQSIQDPTTASNWLLTKDAWWFFAHPIVYFPLLIFLGGLYFFVPRYGKENSPYNKWVYRPWPFYFAFSVLVFSHHVFMDIPNPVWLQMLSQTATLGIVWPSGLTIITILTFVWRSKISWNITSRFFMAGLAGWAFGGFQGAQTGMWGTDMYLHNTMSIPGHIHMILLLGPLLFAFGVFYAIFPDLTKKHMSKTLGEIHFWMTIFGGFGFALLFNIIGTEGAIRREAVMPDAWGWAMPWLLFFALIVGIAQFLFVYNFARAAKRKPTAEEIAEYNSLHRDPQSMGTAEAA